MAEVSEQKTEANLNTGSAPEIENYSALSSFFDFENAMLQRNIGLFDQKSAVLLACNLAIILYLFSSNGVLANEKAGTALTLLTYGCIFLFILSSSFAFLAVRPRVAKSNDVVFWGSKIYEQKLEAYIERVKALQKKDLLEQRLKTSYVLARICKQKFCWLQRAFFTAIIAFVALIISQFFNFFLM